MDLHVLYPHHLQVFRGCLGSKFYAGLSGRPVFRRSFRLPLHQTPADYMPGPVGTRMAHLPTGVAALPVPVLPMTESLLEPHTLNGSC